MKECIKCKTRHPLDNFYTCYGSPRGECKECFKKYLKQSNKLRSTLNKLFNVKRDPSYFRNYYQLNKEKCREYGRKFRLKNPNYFKEYYRQRKGIPAKSVA